MNSRDLLKAIVFDAEYAWKLLVYGPVGLGALLFSRIRVRKGIELLGNETLTIEDRG
jgi:hypothetical protein